jgi:hypothetical protein
MPGTHHLFTVTRVLLKLATLFSLFLIALLGLVLGALVLAALGVIHLPIPADEVRGIPIGQILGVTSMAIAAGITCIALVAWMFLLTARIIDSASTGDPFVTGNADRLMLIGWLLVAFIAIQFLGNRILHQFMENLAAEHHMPISAIGKIDFGSDISPVAILAILLIFVLAQIFRRGAEMRAELEGTV